MEKKPPTGQRIADAIRRSAELHGLHGTANFTPDERAAREKARDKLLDAAMARAREFGGVGELDDDTLARVVDEMAPNPFPAVPVSQGARAALANGLEWDPESSAIWEVEYRRTIGHEGTALLSLSTEPGREITVAIIRRPGTPQLSIDVRGHFIRIVPAANKDGVVLSTGARLLRAFNAEPAATTLAALAVDRADLPIPVTGRADEHNASVINSVEIKTLKSAQPETLGWFARGRLGGLEREFGVVFLPPDLLAIREELRQFLVGERKRLAGRHGRTAAPRAKRSRVNDTPDEIAQRGEIRARWLDHQIYEKGWSSECDIKKPTYKTVMRYRSGQASTRGLSVRSDLANAFGCRLDEVPE
jgi:hypothetical protein